MSKKMANVDFPQQRGCFIEINEKTGERTLVDYPTWSLKNGRAPVSANAALPEDMECTITFPTAEEAQAYCKEQNYVCCARMRDKKPEAVVEEPAA